MLRVLANVSVLAVTLVAVALFGTADARPANAASYSYRAKVYSAARYVAGGVDKACVYRGYYTGHNGVDLHNKETCSSAAGAGVALVTRGNTTDPSGGAQINASASITPLTVQVSPTCLLHYIHATVKKPYLNTTAWVERFMHASRTGSTIMYVGFAYSPSDQGAWATNFSTVGSMYNEGSGCNPQYWTGYHVHQQRYSLGIDVTASLNSFFNISCCSVNNFNLWDQPRESFRWWRII